MTHTISSAMTMGTGQLVSVIIRPHGWPKHENVSVDIPLNSYSQKRQIDEFALLFCT